MPTLLPPPRDWQAFEDLCCDLWRELWSYPETQKHGRSGQAQAGVDVVGREDGFWVGVQCKHKQGRAGLTRAEIEEEVGRAKGFAPPLTKLLIATTAPSDVVAQEIARKITEQHGQEGAFPVTIVSWDDIQLHLAGYPGLIAKHYADLAAAFQTGVNLYASEEALLDLWLRQVAADHSQLAPYFQRQPELLDLLQRVYVELEMTSALDRRDRVALAEAGTTPRELREILELDPAVHPWVTRRWVILGDPGAGKTTLLRHFTASLALEPSQPWVPIFQSLPKLLRSDEFLLDPIGRRMERLGQSGERLKAVLERLGREGRLLVLLDGLDEVPRQQREEAEEILRGLADCWPASPLVVTSRPIGYRQPAPGFLELTLLPLDDSRRREFLARWLGRETGIPDPDRAAQALAALDSPELRELAGNPLYLTLMALLFEGGVAPDRNRTQLYDQVFGLLFEGRHRGEPRKPLEAQDTVRTVLRRLAYDMTVDHRDSEPVTALETRLRSRQFAPLRTTLGQVAGWSEIRQFLDDVGERTGILAAHDGVDADWRFWHRTFREALAAEQLATDWKSQQRAGLLSRLWPNRSALPALARRVKAKEDLDRWAEPFALLVGHVDQPDALVRALVRKNLPLGLRALATAQGVAETTLEEILALTENWRQRSEVFRRVPERVGEPRRALTLLDRLRRQTRNGNDLYFLDLAVQEVARRSPEIAREAAEVRARFFSHIPQPDPSLFGWIETPRDGRVPLWRKIPAGRFWMGSPEGEGTDQEHPRHEVTLATAFQLGAVTVTNAQYIAFDPNHEPRSWPGVAEEDLGFNPVETVTWFEAVSFCRWLSACFSWARGARLPIEEEWEYACRAGSQGRYWSGDDEGYLSGVGWYSGNSDDRTHWVGEKPANPWGLYDVHGNVWEWTLNPWTAGYQGREEGVIFDPAKIEIPAEESPSGGRRVVRGGSFWSDADDARAAYRDSWNPDVEFRVQGFRVLLPFGPELSVVDP